MLQKCLVQPVWVFNTVFVYLSCIWLFWCFLAFLTADVTFITDENLATLHCDHTLGTDQQHRGK